MILSKLRKLAKLSIIGLVFMAVFSIGVGAVYANSSSTAQGSTTKTIYKFGTNVVVTGTVDGDVYCAGQTVTIDATVNGDVLCAGQTVTVNGTVNGNIRVAGQTVTISAKVGNNATVVGQTVTLDSISSVGRDVAIVGQQLQLDGSIGRNVDLVATNAIIDGTINGDVVANVGNDLTLTSAAKIGGNIDYTSPQTMTKTASAEIAGTTTYHEPKTTYYYNNSAWFGWAMLWWGFWVVSLAFLSVILVALFPRLFSKIQSNAYKQPGYIALTGLAAMFVAPTVIVTAFITVIGIPFGVLLVLLWSSILMLSLPTAMYLLGSRLLPQTHRVLAVLLGALIIGVVGIIPIVGWLLVLIAIIFGTGTLLWCAGRFTYQKSNSKAVG